LKRKNEDDDGAQEGTKKGKKKPYISFPVGWGLDGGMRGYIGLRSSSISKSGAGQTIEF
jgi:hypothetical protein